MLKNSNYMKNVKKPSGMDYKKTGMYLIAIAMAVIIIYFVVSTIRNQYNKTVMGEPWLVENTKDASDQLLVPGKVIPRQVTDSMVWNIHMLFGYTLMNGIITQDLLLLNQMEHVFR